MLMASTAAMAKNSAYLPPQPVQSSVVQQTNEQPLLMTAKESTFAPVTQQKAGTARQGDRVTALMTVHTQAPLVVPLHNSAISTVAIEEIAQNETTDAATSMTQDRDTGQVVLNTEMPTKIDDRTAGKHTYS